MWKDNVNKEENRIGIVWEGESEDNKRTRKNRKRKGGENDGGAGKTKLTCFPPNYVSPRGLDISNEA